jgi:hypothetical protein
MRLGVGWYTEASYPDLLEVSEDRDTLPATFAEWERGVRKLLFTLRGEGLEPEQFFVDIKELVSWCRERRLPVIASSRAKFVSERVGASPENRPLRL